MNKSADETIYYIFIIFIVLIINLYLYQQGFFNNNNTNNNNNNIKKDNMKDVSNPLIHTINNDEKQKIIKEHYMPIIKKNKPIGPVFGFHEYFDKLHDKVNGKTLGWRNWWLNNKTDLSKLPKDPNFTNITPIHKWNMDRYIN